MRKIRVNDEGRQNSRGRAQVTVRKDKDPEESSVSSRLYSIDTCIVTGAAVLVFAERTNAEPPTSDGIIPPSIVTSAFPRLQHPLSLSWYCCFRRCSSGGLLLINV